jgi:ParB family chromosome partitioning protein
MYRENAERADLSAYETGMMFTQWIEAGIFATQRAIGDSIGQSEGNVGKYVSIAALPDFILHAFHDPRLIAVRWSTDLAKVARDPSDEIKRLAGELAKQEPAPEPEAVFGGLTGAIVKSKPKAKISDGPKRDAESVKEGNKVLFELSAREGRFGIRLGKHIDRKLRKPLQRELKEWLHIWLKDHS